MYLCESVLKRIKPYLEESKDTDSCVMYPKLNFDGYGYFGACEKGKYLHYLMHRVAYQLYYGDNLISDNMICHKCDNPSCVNPKHLFKGTHVDNVKDRVAKNRSAIGKHNGRYKTGHYTKEAKQFRKEHPELRRHASNYSAERALKVRELFNQGYKVREIQEIVKLNKYSIYNIIKNKTYKDL